MSVDGIAGALAPGFARFLVGVGVLLVGAIVLALIGLWGPASWARRARIVNRYVLLCVLSLIVLFPIYITVVNSLLPADKIAARPPTLVPTHPLWSGYSQAWTQGNVSSYLFNSFVVTFLIVAGQLTTSICAGYAFAFLDFPFKRTIFVVFLATLMVPFEVVFFTNLQTIVTLGRTPLIGRFLGLDTYGALVVPFLATGFGAFLVRQAFLQLPPSSTATGTSASCGASRCPWRGRRSLRSRCSRSSTRGTSTSGPSWSPTTTGPCRSGCAS
jgi:ABC-type spermidine/putrescine transport system permease subunit II